MALSGLAWTIVYVDAIRIGFRQRTFAIPAFALALNLAWELTYGIYGLMGTIGLQSAVNVIWAGLDIVIGYTFIRFGRKYWPDFLRKRCSTGGQSS